MAESRGFKPVYSSRYVYNSNYVDVQLFDVQQVEKMLAMYRYTKPNILFSDVVKKKPVLHTVTNCVNTDSVKAKIGLGKNNQQSGSYNVVRTCVSKYKDTMVKCQKVGHSKNIEKCTDSIANTCHVNRFAVLQTVNGDSIDNNEVISTVVEVACICLFGVLRRFQHCTGHITTGSWKGRGNQYIEFARVVYCKLPTNGKQLPAFPLTAMMGIEPRPQRWEARVLPLCHRGPRSCL